MLSVERRTPRAAAHGACSSSPIRVTRGHLSVEGTAPMRLLTGHFITSLRHSRGDRAFAAVAHSRLAGTVSGPHTVRCVCLELPTHRQGDGPELFDVLLGVELLGAPNVRVRQSQRVIRQHCASLKISHKVFSRNAWTVCEGVPV